MTTDQKPNTAATIKRFFFPDLSSKDALTEIKALTAQDKEQLAKGVNDGTFTY